MNTSNYMLDNDGYVVIEFAFNKNNFKKVQKIKKEKNTIINKNVWNVLSGIEDKRLIENVNSKTLTKNIIQNSEITDLIRGAYYNEYLAEMIKKYFYFRPLPIKTYIEKIKDGELHKIKCNLFAHQTKVLMWMRTKEIGDHRNNYGINGGIIKLEMGLGKTLTGITHSLISPRPSCKEEYGENGFPTLIIASKTVMLEWKIQGFDKFFGDNVKVLYLHKEYIGKERLETISRKDIVKYDFVVTTYDVCNSICKKKEYYKEVLEMGSDHTLMKGKIISVHPRTRNQSDKPKVIGPSIIYTTPWERVIADESQRFANPDIATYKYMMSVYGRYKWCLTGTPIRNFCFTGETRVITNKGNITIRNLVRTKQDDSLRILSYNIPEDKFEYKRLENGWELKTEKGLVSVSTGTRKLTCTPDHKILVIDPESPLSPVYKEAQYLKEGTYVVYYAEENIKSGAIDVLSKDQEQVVIGSYLGDGHFETSKYFRTTMSISHSEKQKEYCEWKANIFQKEVKRKNISSSSSRYANTELYSFDTRSFYFPFNGIQSKKTSVPQSIVDKIDELALLIWYLDDGSINKGGNTIELATCGFDDPTQERLVNKLQKMGLECKRSQLKSNGKIYPIITLNVKGTRNLIGRLCKYDVPQCMRYKIYCIPLLNQIEDSSKNPSTDVFLNKHNIPFGSRHENMIIREYSKGEKINTYKWSTCKKCKMTSFFCLRSDTNTFRCMTGCRKRRPKNHILFSFTGEKRTVSNCFAKAYKIHPVTKIEFIETPRDKTVFDIQVEDNHNFAIGSKNSKYSKFAVIVSNCTDIWSQLRFCGYNGVERTIEWKRKYATKMKEHNLTSHIFSMDYKAANIILPPKHNIKTTVVLRGKEQECYNYVIGILRNMYDKLMANLCDFSCVLALFTRLRQCVIAPYLLTAESKREKGTTEEQRKDKQALDMLKNIHKGSLGEWVHDKSSQAGIYSAKITEIINTLKSINKHEKVIVFSMFTSVLDLLADAIYERLPGFRFIQVDGDTKGKEREDNLIEFRTSIKTQGLFMTYKVGAEGLNLIEATHIICIEPWWTSAVEDQAEHRAYRFGQTKEVKIYKIYAENSIEDRIIEICDNKKKMANEILEGTGKEIKTGIGLNKYTLGQILERN